MPSSGNGENRGTREFLTAVGLAMSPSMVAAFGEIIDRA